ncbi:TIM barrel protein [Aureimonas ureilytica]|uniref:TIM barrel protein n=1 Tax=Aureimonas ureilytica TaxID=401562 RepID=UPI000B33ACF4|nr:TIM barrel protein [Aureimonas ureilytica]
MVDFAVNHRVAPRLGLDRLIGLTRALGISSVEIRNDLPGVALSDGTSPDDVRRAAEAAGVRILSVNALQRFNHWTPHRAEEARALVAQAKAAGAEALVLCPVNEQGFWTSDEVRLSALREALAGLAPILKDAGILGYIEPLGFAECSLRLKSEAVAAIDAVGEADRFKLVHDTFHHFVAGEREMFPERTGLVHISGVEDASVPREAMRDPHRVLVGPADRIGNCDQIRALVAGGYAGPLSFEPFAADVAESPDVAADLRASMEFVAAGLRSAAA